MIDAEYKSLLRTAKFLRLGDLEDLRSFLLTCDRVGAVQAAAYVRGCLEVDGQPLKNMILYKLSLDQEVKK